jgi:hypothetical protein
MFIGMAQDLWAWTQWFVVGLVAMPSRVFKCQDPGFALLKADIDGRPQARTADSQFA